MTNEKYQNVSRCDDDASPLCQRQGVGAEETLTIHLGPGWYIENQDVKIEPNDRVEVKGSRIVYEGKPALIAAEVKKGDEVLTLCEENGFPTWNGWKRR